MPKKYKLGIAFSGGGAKAAAHCGAVQALKEFGIRPDILAGTSAGSLVAALFNLRLKNALPVIFAGVVVAGLVVFFITYGVVLIA